MKHNNVFSGIVLIGLGLYYLSQNWTFPYLEFIHNWPTLMLVFGIAFLIQGKLSKDTTNYFPGIILVGLGIHFHATHLVKGWPNQWEIYILLIGIAFISQANRTKRQGTFLGSLFVLISILGLFSTGFVSWAGKLFDLIESFWYIVLIVIGIYMVVKRR